MNKHTIRRLYKAALIAMDVLFTVAACVFAFYNAGGYQGALLKWTSIVWIWTLGNVALTVFLFSVFGLYKIIFHSVGIMEIIRLMLAVFMIAIINFLFAFIVRSQHSGVGPGVVII